ncbi:hypothetical protein LCER1_G006878 [Lachnellula cervina]|uniref:AB hydrolase-1 domain-containing protein n=1 Tax=Lachnellula cervina TaxID=1316786 RepID=A0A7D8UMB2_9HELO|nr:hypothetical protein LCER1_G006878 [Lachnellula cervina]
MQGTLLPHAMNVFETPSPPPAWQEPGFEGSLAYLRCVQDKAVPVFVQDMMMEKTGVEWIVGDIDTSHFPFLSRPSEVTEVLTKWPEMFSKVKAND